MYFTIDLGAETPEAVLADLDPPLDDLSELDDLDIAPLDLPVHPHESAPEGGAASALPGNSSQYSETTNQSETIPEQEISVAKQQDKDNNSQSSGNHTDDLLPVANSASELRQRRLAFFNKSDNSTSSSQSEDSKSSQEIPPSSQNRQSQIYPKLDETDLVQSERLPGSSASDLVEHNVDYDFQSGHQCNRESGAQLDIQAGHQSERDSGAHIETDTEPHVPFSSFTDILAPGGATHQDSESRSQEGDIHPAPPTVGESITEGETDEPLQSGHIKIRIKYLDDRQKLVQARPEETIGEFKR